MDKKLDLSRLTEEEAKHVWEVIQRDFDLRKKEEERLGEIKSKIEKEETKRELLGSQSNLTDSHCIRCLQPFKFLVNSKRQCMDCKLYTCKSCSRYNKKEHGWVCDPCRMSRVLKIGTLGWYHDNIHSRFKRFGSAKVMRSLYKRLNEEGHRDDDTQSMPDVRNVYNGHDEHLDASEAQRYKQMRKTKRLLSVHPMDLDMDDYATHSRRQSVQYMHEDRGQRNDVEYNSDMYHHHHHHRMNRRKSLDKFSRPDEGMHSEHRMVRARSLSKINSSVAPRQIYLDTSEEDDMFRYPVYQLPPRRRSRASSQENIHQSAPPINELNKRMYAIESLLNRLEEKITLPPDQPVQPTAGQMEEEKLRRKLDELMSDKALSSDEDEPKKPSHSKGSAVRGDHAPMATTCQEPLSSSSDEIPTEAQKRSTAAALCDITTEILRTINATENAMNELAPSNPNDRPQLAGTDLKQADDAFRELEENVYMTAGKSFEMAKKLQMIEQNAKNHYSGPLTDSELSELEDQVALAAAKVQSTESEVSDIESKISALSAKGLSFDKAKKKALSIQQKRKFSQDRVHF
ncbi:rab effector MyRIP-like isoform X1 [Sinocyclocheilus grahami]|uniref:Melanophilin-like n=1 Tax=Sinocyclocheilus grahami TaxID=75366 RepID=A0A672RSU6_SINGR|nr:PREDICTED: rab effector MyRIP-like isoform X1 [Sinocyclocheilus grahami]XP_016142512.1 PREDICTED: rab effector MyRIP-like isoform X1 [Sinocyclocheilus grahami]